MIIPLWIVYSLASAIFFGLKDILAKEYLSKKDGSPKDIILHEYLLLFFFVTLAFYPQINFLSFLSLWHLYLLKAVSVGLATFLYFSLLEKHEISTVSPLINLSPLFLLVLSSIFLLESITSLQLVGIFIIILATYFLEIVNHHHHKKNPHKHHLINLNKKDYSFFMLIISLLFVFSFAAIADKMLLQIVDVYTNMFFTSTIILAAILCNNLKKKNLRKSFESLNRGHMLLIISFLTIASNFLILFAIAIPGALVSLIIPLRRTSTLFSSFFGGLLFHEKHLGKKLLAILLMLIGVVLIVWNSGIILE